MKDRRENILAQLLVIAEAIPGITRAVRNERNISEDQRPAVMIFDADEVGDEQDTTMTRPAAAPRMMTLSPEIYVVLGAPVAGANVGTLLSGFRALLIAAIVADATLIGPTCCGTNGEIRYLHTQTALAAGRSMEGEMLLGFAFRYPLASSELT